MSEIIHKHDIMIVVRSILDPRAQSLDFQGEKKF